MERLLYPYDKETMRMVILKHEETFKEQVFELHRLYRMQKILMKNMNSGVRGRDNRINLSEGSYFNREQPRRILDLERPADEYIMDGSGDGVLETGDENDIELTLGPTRFQRKKEDRMTHNSDAGPSFSSSSTESSFIQRNHKRAERREELRLIQVPNVNPSFQSGKNAFDVDENLRQERLNQPPWLFQVLSLNMT